MLKLVDKFFKPSLVKRHCYIGLITQSTRSVAEWNYEWQPGPYPKTEAERIVAAKKYGLHPDDYKPYPDDGYGIGDYPMIEPVSAVARDPYESYDYPDEFRNYGDIHHRYSEIYAATFLNSHFEKRIPVWQAFLFNCSFVAVITFLVFGPMYLFPGKQPWSKRQLISDGTKHYTFEPADA